VSDVPQFKMLTHMYLSLSPAFVYIMLHAGTVMSWNSLTTANQSWSKTACL